MLRIGVAVSDALAEIHGAHVIHKDLNPANILYLSETGQVRIIDFGASIVVSRENPVIQNPHHLEGTLAYMSPEQTGRMNRLLDYRTDFYSLGVTLYELLVGETPFKGDDPLELIHCHIASPPVPPHELAPFVPKVLSNIVMKLLAKTAERRYKSAWGIKSDLLECLQRLTPGGEVSAFALGQKDISERLIIPQKLYGRAAEIEILRKGFDRVCRGHKEMLLISGHAGIGKTSLVQEVFKVMTERQAFFLSGKFDSLRREMPYVAIVSAFQRLAQLLLCEEQSGVERWRARIQKAVAQNGQIIVEMIPEMGLLMGPQPPLDELPPAETQNRFLSVWQRFVEVFAQKEHPLIVFLDDLQSADYASLQLLRTLSASPAIPCLYLLCTFRDNEVVAGQPLGIFLDEIAHDGHSFQAVHLGPLSPVHITELLTEVLQCDSDRAKPLAALLAQKTGGNPFFLNEFLFTLHKERLLRFEKQPCAWQWDEEEIRRYATTDNVADLMIAKIQRLSPNAQKVLKVAACIGHQFRRGLLMEILELEDRELQACLGETIEEGLVLPLEGLLAPVGGGVAPPDSARAQECKFVHDRVVSAAYALLADEDRRLWLLKTQHSELGWNAQEVSAPGSSAGRGGSGRGPGNSPGSRAW